MFDSPATLESADPNPLERLEALRLRIRRDPSVMVDGALHDTEGQDPVSRAVAVIDAAIAADHTIPGDAALSEQVVACTRLVDRARTLQVLSVAAWEPRQVWAGTRTRSAHRWLQDHTDCSSGEAHTVLTGARLVRDHEPIARRVRSGEMPCRKLDLLAGLATPDRTELFARDVDVLARNVTRLGHREAQIMTRRWKQLADDALASDDAATQRARRRLHHSRVAEIWKTDGQFDLVDGQTIDTALRDAMDEPDDPDCPGGPRTTEQRRADALLTLATFWLAHRNEQRPANPIPSATLHLNESGLTGTPDGSFDPGAICDLVPGGPVARSTAQRLLCDSVVGRVVLDAEREVIDHGRQKRLFTPAQRRAIIARDGPTCVVPGCRVPVDDCELHHLQPFSEGGRTTIEQGAFICHRTHHDIHDRGYDLTRLAAGQGYRLTAPDGRTWTSDDSTWGATARLERNPD